ncbi:MAG: DUF6516 family protein [Anaerolineales bacterium]|nr:DUF6516 family protein [Anaerolineales bacterium]
MLAIYQSLVRVASAEFDDVVVGTTLIGGTPANPNKLRLKLRDGSFLDIWLSLDGDYAYHWELRRQRGRLYRWDNAPHYPHVETFPAHFHDGDENTIIASQLSNVPEDALRQVLAFVKLYAGHTERGGA